MSQLDLTDGVNKRTAALSTGFKGVVNESVKVVPGLAKKKFLDAMHEQVAWATALWEALKTPMGRWTNLIMLCAYLILGCGTTALFIAFNSGRMAERGLLIYLGFPMITAFFTVLLFYNSTNSDRAHYVVISAIWAIALIGMVFVSLGIVTTYTTQNGIIWLSTCKPFWANSTGFVIETVADWGFRANVILCQGQYFPTFAATSWIVAIGVWGPLAVLFGCLVWVVGYYMLPWNNAAAIIKSGTDKYTAVMNGMSPDEANKLVNDHMIEYAKGSADVTAIAQDNIGSVLDAATKSHGDEFRSDIMEKKKVLGKTHRFMPGKSQTD